MTDQLGKKNCIKQYKQATDKQNNLQCNQCRIYLHLKCPNTIKKNYISYKKLTKKFICEYCMYYTCLGYNQHVYDGQVGVQCDQCDILFHRKCIGLTKQQFRYLQNNTNDPQYCRSYTKDMLPFYDLTNK